MYENLISIENLFQAWDGFKKGKRGKRDVQEFERNLEDNLFELHLKLKKRIWQHGNYEEFYVNDPKRRHIHKAVVADRIIHHVLYKYLYQLFDNNFIYDSYSCRDLKGTHKAVQRLVSFSRRVSKSYTRDCWALKCDIKKFFATVDHKILLELLSRKIENQDISELLGKTIQSFHSEFGQTKGIPLGNLTSQVFANIYLNELDQFIKHKLRIKYYLRYADDFLILSDDQMFLKELISKIQLFLEENLKLTLHEKKVIIRKLNHGIDFLGYVVLPYYVLPRTKTRRRMFKRINKSNMQSYLGYLSHANSYRLSQALKNVVFISMN